MVQTGYYLIMKAQEEGDIVTKKIVSALVKIKMGKKKTFLGNLDQEEIGVMPKIT